MKRFDFIQFNLKSSFLKGFLFLKIMINLNQRKWHANLNKIKQINIIKNIRIHYCENKELDKKWNIKYQYKEKIKFNKKKFKKK